MSNLNKIYQTIYVKCKGTNMVLYKTDFLWLSMAEYLNCRKSFSEISDIEFM
jgi:hypothetical protein